jgi:drug/metabolite transporter (DMT)-like permease
MLRYIPFILFTVTTNAAAQLMLKHGMSAYGQVSLVSGSVPLKILQIIFSPWVFAGLLMFVVSTLSHLYVLSKVELSFAYPFLSLAYVMVTLFAFFVFHEDVDVWRIAGLTFICVGTVLIAQSGRSHEEGASPHEEKTASISQQLSRTSELVP